MTGEWRRVRTQVVSRNALLAEVSTRDAIDSAFLVGVDVNGRSQRYQIGVYALLGRDSGADVVSESFDASRRHAAITRTAPSEYIIEDLGSANGTYLNGTKVRRQPIAFGDVLRLGLHSHFIFTHSSGLDARLVDAQGLGDVDRVLAAVAHHFNNPLMVLLFAANGFAGLPPTMMVGDRRTQDHLRDIRTAIDRIGLTIRQLLDVTRKESFEEEIVDISELVASVLPALSAYPEVRVDVRCESELHSLGDREQLARALLNLCVNGCEAMPSGGQLTITVAMLTVSPEANSRYPSLAPGRYVSLSIADTGTGMDCETRTRVFEPFFSTKGPSSIGLGIPAASRIARNHGGLLTIDDDLERSGVVEGAHPGGSVFRLVLPYADAHLNTSSYSGVVFVADHDTGDRSHTIAQCRALKRKAVGLPDGRQVLFAYLNRSEDIEAIILDLSLQDPDVIEVYRALKGLAPQLKVFCSGNGTQEHKLTLLLKEGLAGYLPKPLTEAAIAGALK